jgi:hypothetical protein
VERIEFRIFGSQFFSLSPPSYPDWPAAVDAVSAAPSGKTMAAYNAHWFSGVGAERTRSKKAFSTACQRLTMRREPRMH